MQSKKFMVLNIATVVVWATLTGRVIEAKSLVDIDSKHYYQQIHSYLFPDRNKSLWYQARQLADQGKFDEAHKILKTYDSNNPRLWYYQQSLLSAYEKKQKLPLSLPAEIFAITSNIPISEENTNETKSVLNLSELIKKHRWLQVLRLTKQLRKKKMNSKQLCEVVSSEAIAYSKLKKQALSLKSFEHWDKSCAKNAPASEQALQLYRWGYLYWNMSQNDKAEIKFKKLITDYATVPIVGEALLALGYLYQNQNSHNSAISMFRQFMEKYVDHSEYTQAVFSLFLNYYLDKQYNQSLKVLTKLSTSARNLFWTAKAQSQLGKFQQARQTLAHLTERFPYDYYAIRAYMSLGNIELAPSLYDQPLQLDYTYNKRPKELSGESLDRLKSAEVLLESGYQEYAAKELQKIERIKENKSVGYVVYIGLLQYLAGNYLEAVKGYQEAISLDSQLPKDFIVLNYPVAYESIIDQFAQMNQIDSDMVLALIRQESCFNPEAQSGANARGLMQMIPSTARRTITQLSKEYKSRVFKLSSNAVSSNISSLLFEPYLNVGLGTYHLKQLLAKDDFDIVTIMNYNAGETPVNRWLKLYDTRDLDLFIERVPYSETRNYVKYIVRNTYNYKRLFRGKVSEHPFKNDFEERSLAFKL